MWMVVSGAGGVRVVLVSRVIAFGRGRCVVSGRCGECVVVGLRTDG